MLDAAPIGVERRQIVLRGDHALFRGFAEPARGLRIILRNARPVGVSKTEIELGRGVVLLGGAVVPDHRAHGVLGNPETVVVERAQIVLRIGQALHRGFQEQLGGFLVVLLDAGAEGVAHTLIIVVDHHLWRRRRGLHPRAHARRQGRRGGGRGWRGLRGRRAALGVRR